MATTFCTNVAALCETSLFVISSIMLSKSSGGRQVDCLYLQNVVVYTKCIYKDTKLWNIV